MWDLLLYNIHSTLPPPSLFPLSAKLIPFAQRLHTPAITHACQRSFNLPSPSFPGRLFSTSLPTPNSLFSSDQFKNAPASRLEHLPCHPPQTPLPQTLTYRQRPLGSSKGEYAALHISSTTKVGKQPPALNTKTCLMLCG